MAGPRGGAAAWLRAGAWLSLLQVALAVVGSPRGVDRLWPQPNGKVEAAGPPLLLSANFTFRGPSGCPRLDRAFQRYLPLVLRAPRGAPLALASAASPSAGRVVLGLDVELADRTVCGDGPGGAPAFGEDESYALDVRAPRAALRAHGLAGVLRGMETLSQLVSCGGPLGGEPGPCGISSGNITIEDRPRFGWRGVMLDTARHFLPLDVILKMLDAMAYNKLNVLHWHITDDQSFPLRTEKYPKLAEGAYGPRLTYSHADVARAVEAAADRAIRVVPELDTPGHALSWAAGYPELVLQECHTLDPTSEGTYSMLEAVFGEVAAAFPDAYVHLGCDEVSFACWNQSARVVRYMEEHNIPRDNLGFKHLTARYIGRLQRIVKSLGKTPVVWQEAMDHYGPSREDPTPPAPELEADTVVEQWLAPPWNWANLSSILEPGYLGRNITWAHGFRALTTNGWYLDSELINEWEKVYAMEPLTNASCVYDGAHPQGRCSCTCTNGPWRDGRCHCFDLRASPAAADGLLGGEAPLWGEHIDATNLFVRAFPRLSAVAERLWSRMEQNNATEAAPRLEAQRCRMIARGVEVTPLGPGFCPGEAGEARGAAAPATADLVVV